MLDFKRDIEPYLQLGADGKPLAKYYHAFYQASIDHRNRLRQVFKKAYPDYLNINRPKEREAYKKYRADIYRNPLRSFRRRVIDAFDYIRQADDFEVAFPRNAGTDDSDSLESYVTDSRFTKDGDATSWFFGKVRKKYVDDPNAVLIVLPLTQPATDSERVRPVPMLVGCENVYQHRKGEFCVVELPEKAWIQGPDKLEKTGKVLVFVDADSYCIARQLSKQANVGSVNPATAYTYEWDVLGTSDLIDEAGQRVGIGFAPTLHNCPVMPARKIGKINEDEAEERVGRLVGSTVTNTIASTYRLVSSSDAGEEYYESILADALPHIEGAQEVGSDIQVERNFHVSGEEWRYAQRRCPDSFAAGGGNCVDGSVPIRNLEGEITGKVKCQKCEGGYMSGSGVGGLILVTAPSANTIDDEGRPANLPTPPGGFIPRNIEPLKEFVKEFEREKKQAYETVNMQFLMESPIDQSGTAKRMDREELYRTLIVEGAHLCSLLQFFLECVAYQRLQQTDAPTVLAPVRLSIENSELTRQELVEAVEKEFDTNLRAPLEKKLIEYQAGKDSDYYHRYELREKLDQYPKLSFESKLFLLSAARLTMQVDGPEYTALSERIWFSINFDGILSDMLRSGEGFWNLKVEAQYQKMLAANKLLIAPAKPVSVDPLTGLPSMQEGQLVPIADIKNNNQL